PAHGTEGTRGRTDYDAVLRRLRTMAATAAMSPIAPTITPMIASVFALSTSLCFTVLDALPDGAVVGVGVPVPSPPAVRVTTGAGLSGSGPPGGVTCTQFTVEPSLYVWMVGNVSESASGRPTETENSAKWSCVMPLPSVAVHVTDLTALSKSPSSVW